MCICGDVCVHVYVHIQEHLYNNLRSSCQDVYQDNTWLGCAEFIPGFTNTTTACMWPPNTLNNPNAYICACDCSTPQAQAACMYGSSNTDSTIAYTMNSMNATFSAAAAALSEANRQLFNTTGVYGIIAQLQKISSLASSNASFNMYQKV